MATFSDVNGLELIAYGGAFDPPHMGHLDAANLALSSFPNAEMLILPAAAPAGAGGDHKSVAAPFAHRFSMCETQFAALGQRATVSTLEKDLPRPNYTVQTLRRLQARLPRQRLGFLLGEDQLTSFHRWHEPLEVLKLAKLLVVARRTPFGPRTGALTATVENLAQNLGLSWAWRDSQASLSDGAKGIAVLSGDLNDAASSELRRQLARGEAPPAGWLHPEVLTYIEKHGLYRI